MHFVNNHPSYPVTAKNIQNRYTDVTDDKKFISVRLAIATVSSIWHENFQYGNKNFTAGLPLNRLDENLTGY